jgi:hypothetical protein
MTLPFGLQNVKKIICSLLREDQRVENITENITKTPEQKADTKQLEMATKLISKT